jgi:hypothetical protein
VGKALGHPDVEKILGKCQPSPFGKGDKTVMDLEYRDGKEIAAKDIVIASGSERAKEALYVNIQDQISQSLFGGKSVQIELYKLAVYGKDGHFDWHRDTTHGDDHHATVLVALNTEWKGGNLGLRHQQTAVDVDLHPVTVVDEKLEWDEDDDEEEDGDDDKGDSRKGKESEKSEDKPKLGFQIIAFYTDIEHKVERITDGTRIVLQFDVNVKGGQNDYSEEALESNCRDSGVLGVSESFDTVKPLFPVLEIDNNRDAILKELVAMIKEKHSSNSVDEVVFPLRHLYRMASIKPEYLKGIDEYLHENLKKIFDVSLKPIILVRHTDHEGNWASGKMFGTPFVSEHDAERKRPEKKRKVGKKSEIHVPAQCELRKLSSTDYIEYMGNEAQCGEGRYFGGGMFVKCLLERK